MTVFNAFLKILKRNKVIIIIYTVMLIVFGGLNMTADNNATNFESSKPDVYIENKDDSNNITNNFIKYMKENSNIKKIDKNIEDALFYQEIDLIIYIPKNYGNDFINGNSPEIEIKKSTGANSSYAKMLVERYLKVASIYQKENLNENEVISKINNALTSNIKVDLKTKLDTNKLARSTFYFNFESYSIMACLIYVICLIMSTFNNELIRKRNIISSTNYRKLNSKLLLYNCLFAFIVWLIYLVMGHILLGDIILSKQGVIYAVNSLIFTMCAVSLSFLISTLVTKKEAINGIVNVIAVGSSFLCGAFVPSMWLPDSVLTMAHIFPTYYYINTNDTLTKLEEFSFETLKPILINMIIMIIFIIVFIVIANIISKRKRKIG